LRLGKLRGGYKEGTRHRALWQIGVHGRRVHVAEDELRDTLLRVAGCCFPPLGADAVNKAMRDSAESVKRHFSQGPSDATLIRMLQITEREKKQLWFSLPRTAKACDSARRRRVMEERRARLWQECARAQRWLSCREASIVLLQNHGISANHVTLATDLQYLKARYPHALFNRVSAGTSLTTTSTSTKSIEHSLCLKKQNERSQTERVQCEKQNRSLKLSTGVAPVDWPRIQQ
jgi:hypothetical protein